MLGTEGAREGVKLGKGLLIHLGLDKVAAALFFLDILVFAQIIQGAPIGGPDYVIQFTEGSLGGKISFLQIISGHDFFKEILLVFTIKRNGIHVFSFR